MDGETPRKLGGSLRPAGLERASSALAALGAAAVKAASGIRWLAEHLGDECFVDPNRLVLKHTLGQGNFGRIRLAELRPAPSMACGLGGGAASGGGSTRDVAVKMLRRELLQDPEQVELFLKEVALLRKLHHRHIVEFVGCSWHARASLDDSARGSPRLPMIYYVTEYCGGGSLGDLVRRQMVRPFKQLYSEADALRWCLHVAMALQYLHEARPPVMHRDLKLDNIMLSCADVALADARLADFGLARLVPSPLLTRLLTKLQLGGAATAPVGVRADSAGMLACQVKEQQERPAGGTESGDDHSPAAAFATFHDDFAAVYTSGELTGKTGSFGYMPPEVLRSEQYGAAADIFSLGMCMHNLFARTIPSFEVLLNGTEEHLELFALQVAEGYRPPMPPGLPASVAAVIEACWKGDPDLRPSARRVVEMLQDIKESGEVALDEDGPLPCQSRCCTVM